MLQLILNGVAFHELKSPSADVPHPRLQSALVMKDAPRLARCLLELSLELKNAISVKSALDLFRSISAQAWYDSPFTMRQVPKVGEKTVSLNLRRLLLLAAEVAH